MYEERKSDGRFIMGYVLLTRGVRHFRNLQEHEPARTQVANLQALADKLNVGEVIYGYDYSRKVRCLDDLPQLGLLLRTVKERGGSIVMDDFQRLFRPAPFSERKALFAELLPFGGRFFEANSEKPLAALSAGEVMAIMFEERRMLRQPSMRRKSLSPAKAKRANRISIEARRQRAMRKAKELVDLRRELDAKGEPANHAALARAANARGLRTTTGKTWSRATVRTALLRLKTAETNHEAKDAAKPEAG